MKLVLVIGRPDLASLSLEQKVALEDFCEQQDIRLSVDDGGEGRPPIQGTAYMVDFSDLWAQVQQ